MTRTMQSFISRNRIRMTAERATPNPNMDQDTWGRGTSHWRCKFNRAHWAEMTVYFSQGSAHVEPPNAEDVLDCLASDAVSVHNASGFEDWCAEYGYDTDSRKAERIFKACEQQTANLQAFLGPEAFEALLYNTERQ